VEDAGVNLMTQFSTMHDAPERESSKERLREAEKLEIIGRLAGGVAHDFNNLLTGVLLYCDLMRAELARDRPDTAGLIRHIEEIRAAGEQGAALTQQLLAAARKQPADPRPLQLNLIVASMANLLRKLMGEPIELILTLDPSAGAVLADESQMQQVVLNLALNARDALPRGGKIRIITRAAEFPVAIDHRNDHRKRKASASSSVSLAVKDNGCGMDEEARKRLFEPFFTTKDPGKGTGLGLATVKRIVSEAGGVIEVQSEPGRGTCVEIFFPAMVAAETRLAASAGANERGAGPVST
jgi:two-component system cell cycle sensor histidine kinase/response regulator CckA